MHPRSPPSGANEVRRIRLERFGMALGTYGLVILVAILLTNLGLGSMSGEQWGLFLGGSVAINATFFALFVSGANLRFADPSLTSAQIVVSTLWGLVPLYALPSSRPLLLMFFLLAFSFGMLRFDRRKYFGLLAVVLGIYAGMLAVEYVAARPGFRPAYELSIFLLFGLALSWFAYFGGFVTNLRRRLHLQNLAVQRTNDALRVEIEERTQTAEMNEKLLAELRESLGKVKVLSGLLPICASCKKIRDDTGYWQRIESYLHSHSEAVLTHGICPECAEKLFPGIDYSES